MLSDFQDIIDICESYFANAASAMYNARNHLYYAGDYIAEQDWANAKASLYKAGNAFGSCASKLHAGKSWPASGFYLIDALQWLNDNWPTGAAEVTWKAIVEAWIKDDFAGRVPTIAVIDRMRQILWDEPFNVQWAARPESGI